MPLKYPIGELSNGIDGRHVGGIGKCQKIAGAFWGMVCRSIEQHLEKNLTLALGSRPIKAIIACVCQIFFEF